MFFSFVSMFLRMFKIADNKLKIVNTCKKQVELFRKIKRAFDEKRRSVPAEQQADLAFEFQAFMTEQINLAKQAMTSENNFDFNC